MSKSKGVIGYGLDLQKVKELVEPKITKPVTLKELKHIPRTFSRFTKNHKFRGKDTRFVTIYGAAGEQDIPEPKLKVMSDIYTSATRDFFTDCVLTDPIIAPALDRRTDSLFEDGFHLELEDATARNPVDNQTMTEGEKNEEIVDNKTEFTKHLQKLETWKDDIDLLSNMKDSGGVSWGQGRAVSLTSPGIQELPPQRLPLSVEIINEDDLGEPIVDIGLTKQIVAVNSQLDGKPVIRPDEMIYLTRNKRGYRKEGKFWGASSIEPILQLSKAIKRIYNYDIPEAIIAAYITKVLFTINDQGDPTTQKTRIQTFVDNFLSTGKLAFAMSDEVQKVDIISPKVDTQMIDTLESKLADIILSVVAVPKSMMNREHGLNRDIATIEAIQFIRFVRKPDERLIAEAYENQLFNPLLAHLVGRPLSEIPVRVKIVRNTPEDGDLDSIFTDTTTPLKEEETAGDSPPLEQKNAISVFGAKGEHEIVVKSPHTGDNYIVRRSKADS